MGNQAMSEPPAVDQLKHAQPPKGILKSHSNAHAPNQTPSQAPGPDSIGSAATPLENGDAQKPTPPTRSSSKGTDPQGPLSQASSSGDPDKTLSTSSAKSLISYGHGKQQPLRKTYFQQNTGRELEPLRFEDIPWHSSFVNYPAGHVNLGDFIKKVRDECSQWNVQQWTGNGKHVEKKIGTTPLTTEQYRTRTRGKWFARVSEFKDGVYDYTYDDFARVLRDQHSKHESRYTDDIFDYHPLLKWDYTKDFDQKAILETFEMEHISMEIMQMYHELPGIFRDRVFTTLVLSFTRKDRDDMGNHTKEFCVAQLPVDLHSFPSDMQKQSHCTAHGMKYCPRVGNDEAGNSSPRSDKQNAKFGKRLVEGRYASIERVYRMEQTFEGDSKQASDYPCNVWEMSTVSDPAIWILPKFTHRMVIPPKIAQDVKYVCDYIKNRKEG